MTKRCLFYLKHADPAPFVELFDEVIPYYRAHFKHIPLTENDVVYFGGGTDVNPALYGEEIGVFSNTPDYERDQFERNAFNKHAGKIAGFLGICRGSQFLTVMNGGKLVQHCEGHTRDHVIKTHDGHIIHVTSTHHQMMYPWDLPREEWELLGWSFERLSDVYLNGENDRIDISKITDYKEPEIVWYPKTKSLCIQGHPEYLPYGANFCEYSRQLIKKHIFGEYTL